MEFLTLESYHFSILITLNRFKKNDAMLYLFKLL